MCHCCVTHLVRLSGSFSSHSTTGLMNWLESVSGLHRCESQSALTGRPMQSPSHGLGDIFGRPTPMRTKLFASSL